MNEQQLHEMILEEIYPSGAEEWYCPVCDRRLLIMNWHPDGKQSIIKLGDERSHANIEQESLPQIDISNEYAFSVEEETRLGIWIAWLDEVDFESWWNDPMG